MLGLLLRCRADHSDHPELYSSNKPSKIGNTDLKKNQD